VTLSDLYNLKYYYFIILIENYITITFRSGQHEVA
jgi:hypothetical protein